MNNFLFKLKNRYNITKKNWQSDCHFSKKLGALRILDEWGCRLHFLKLSNWAHKKKDDWILQYLYDILEEVIIKYKDDDYIGEREGDASIWVCWWSGEENAPDLVKQCIKSIRNNSGIHQVNIITKDTYKNFLSIPTYILDKVENNEMCIANFSDYLRASLLEKYGGLWLDATIFCSTKIPEEYFKIPFFTCKSDPVDCRYISQFRWTSFCLGGWKNNIFYRFFKEAFECYWKMEITAIDYLLVDYIIEIAYRNIPKIRQQIDAVEINNPHRDDLQAAMNRAEPAEMFQTLLKSDTVLYKLSWRESYSLKTSGEKESIYAYFLKRNTDTRKSIFGEK